jgi:hypothetical protein
MEVDVSMTEIAVNFGHFYVSSAQIILDLYLASTWMRTMEKASYLRSHPNPLFQHQ